VQKTFGIVFDVHQDYLQFGDGVSGEDIRLRTCAVHCAEIEQSRDMTPILWWEHAREARLYIDTQTRNNHETHPPCQSQCSIIKNRMHAHLSLLFSSFLGITIETRLEPLLPHCLCFIASSNLSPTSLSLGIQLDK